MDRSLFEYDNYRTYLKHHFDAMKARDTKFSHRKFASLAGFKSSSFLFNVMNGKANLSPQAAESLADALQLTRDESFFFRNLVQLNQASTPEERQLYAKQVLKSKAYRRTQVLAESTYLYFTKWYYVAIKEMAGLKDFRDDPKWIAKRLSPEITADEAQRALEDLIKLGMLKKDNQGSLRQAQDVVLTPDEVTSAFITTYHEELIQLGAGSIRRTPRTQRDISATTFAVSRVQLDQIKEIIQRFRKEIVETVAADPGDEALYQLNMQLFPLAPFTVSKE